jgi:hypothetical protein
MGRFGFVLDYLISGQHVVLERASRSHNLRQCNAASCLRICKGGCSCYLLGAVECRSDLMKLEEVASSTASVI